MYITTVLQVILLVSIFSVSFSRSSPSGRESHKYSDDNEAYSAADDLLLLTPLIESGEIKDAVSDAEVKHSDFGNVKSYAGFFTVNKTQNSNLFFWYFPAEVDPANAPVILWLQGGPGDTSMFGLFVEHGPFEIKNGSNIVPRSSYSWAKDHSIIYIDNPVGTGFSFTDPDTLCTSSVQAAEHLYEALKQFFTLFPALVKNEFFIAGESYGGKYVPNLGYVIHQKNPTETLKINLKGLLIDSGLSDPVNQDNYADYFYQAGLIDSNTADEMKKIQENRTKLINSGEYEEAFNVWVGILNLYFGASGNTNTFSFIKPVNPTPEYNGYIKSYLERDDIRTALHAGNRTFEPASDAVYGALLADISQSTAPKVAELLDHYRILIYNGQVDVIVPYPLTLNYLQKLNFTNANEYKTAPRKIWKVDGEVAGYVKVAGKLTEAMVRDAGHLISYDQPKWAHDIVHKFIRNLPIA